MAISRYKTVIQRYMDRDPIYVDFKAYPVPKRYSEGGLDINRFRNTLIVKQGDTRIYRKFGIDPKTVHLSLKFKKVYYVDTPKDLLKLVFSAQGRDSIEILTKDHKYFCVFHSLFVEAGSIPYDGVSPVFLSTIKDTQQLGIKVFSPTLQHLPSSMSKTVMGDLVPLICDLGGYANIEWTNTICEWARPKPKTEPFTLSAEQGLRIAKYYEEVWRNG